MSQAIVDILLSMRNSPTQVQLHKLIYVLKFWPWCKYYIVHCKDIPYFQQYEVYVWCSSFLDFFFPKHIIEHKVQVIVALIRLWFFIILTIMLLRRLLQFVSTRLILKRSFLKNGRGSLYFEANIDLDTKILNGCQTHQFLCIIFCLWDANIQRVWIFNFGIHNALRF